jgi:hypothetical protein
MKRTLTALTVAASLIASGGLAFDMNVTEEEHNRLLGKPMVGDLAVGVKGLLNNWNNGCLKNGKAYLVSTDTLETEPSDYSSHFEIIMETNGGFAVTYVPLKDRDEPIAPHRRYDNCDNLSEYLPEATFYPINSINGFTDWRTLLVDLINQGYQ